MHAIKNTDFNINRFQFFNFWETVLVDAISKWPLVYGCTGYSYTKKVWFGQYSMRKFDWSVHTLTVGKNETLFYDIFPPQTSVPQNWQAIPSKSFNKCLASKLDEHFDCYETYKGLNLKTCFFFHKKIWKSATLNNMYCKSCKP